MAQATPKRAVHIMSGAATRRERPVTPGAAVDPAAKVEPQADRLKRYRRERDEARQAALDQHDILAEREKTIERLTAATVSAPADATLVARLEAQLAEERKTVVNLQKVIRMRRDLAASTAEKTKVALDRAASAAEEAAAERDGFAGLLEIARSDKAGLEQVVARLKEEARRHIECGRFRAD